jgi:excisionase family DNA binding protein
MSDNYMTAEEAAQYLKTSTSTLAKRRVAGTGPRFVRIGRMVRYRRADLDLWIGTTVVSSTSEQPAAA